MDRFNAPLRSIKKLPDWKLFLINEENKFESSRLVYKNGIALHQNFKAGKLLLKLPTSADGISTTATYIYLLMFTKEEFYTCFVLCAHCGNGHGYPYI